LFDCFLSLKRSKFWKKLFFSGYFCVGNEIHRWNLSNPTTQSLVNSVSNIEFLVFDNFLKQQFFISFFLNDVWHIDSFVVVWCWSWNWFFLGSFFILFPSKLSCL
jgi:hypothetical protein